MKFAPTSYDRLLAGRAAALAVALSVLLIVVIVSTDEGQAPFAARLGRFASLLPIAGGLGAFMTAEQARARGELRGLHAIGVAPARALLGAAVGAMLVAAVGPLLASLRFADVDCLYPRLGPLAGTWAATGPAEWHTVVGNAVVRAAGAIDASSGPAVRLAAALPEAPRLFTSTALFAFAVAVPLWAVARGTAARRIAVALVVGIASLTLFHLVAAARIAPWALCVPPLVLLLDALILGRSGACS
jgi:hypothetical protein